MQCTAPIWVDSSLSDLKSRSENWTERGHQAKTKNHPKVTQNKFILIEGARKRFRRLCRAIVVLLPKKAAKYTPLSSICSRTTASSPEWLTDVCFLPNHGHTQVINCRTNTSKHHPGKVRSEHAPLCIIGTSVRNCSSALCVVRLYSGFYRVDFKTTSTLFRFF